MELSAKDKKALYDKLEEMWAVLLENNADDDSPYPFDQEEHHHMPAIALNHSIATLDDDGEEVEEWYEFVSNKITSNHYGQGSEFSIYPGTREGGTRIVWAGEYQILDKETDRLKPFSYEGEIDDVELWAAILMTFDYD